MFCKRLRNYFKGLKLNISSCLYVSMHVSYHIDKNLMKIYIMSILLKKVKN